MEESIQTSDQYSPRSLRRYERIFGADFLSPGGPETTRTICAALGLRAGTRVLDVGSGLGGSAFHMNGVYGAVVMGVDILPQMVAISTQRAAERGMDGVTFIEGDVRSLPLAPASFDLVYSRDTFLHIEDKPGLFRALHRLLAPQGRLFVSDYACGSRPLSDAFISYANGAGYHLEGLDAYSAIIQEAGFQEVLAEDKTATFVDILQREADSIRASASDPECDLDQEDRNYLVERWERKIKYCTDGDMRWVHIHALRP